MRKNLAMMLRETPKLIESLMFMSTVVEKILVGLYDEHPQVLAVLDTRSMDSRSPYSAASSLHKTRSFAGFQRKESGENTSTISGATRGGT